MRRKLEREIKNYGRKGPPWSSLKPFVSLGLVFLILLSFPSPSASQNGRSRGNSAPDPNFYPGRQPGFWDNYSTEATTSDAVRRNTSTSVPESRTATTTEESLLPTEDVTIEMINTTHALITWEPITDRNVTSYTIDVTCERPVMCCDNCNFQDEVEDPPYLVRVDGETRYRVRVAAVTGNETLYLNSEAVLETNATAPNLPRVEVRSTNTSLTWEWFYPCPYTGPVEYLLEVEERRLDVNDTEEDGKCKYSASLVNLVPYTNYLYSLLSVDPNCKAQCGLIIYPEPTPAPTELTTIVTSTIDSASNDSTTVNSSSSVSLNSTVVPPLEKSDTDGLGSSGEASTVTTAIASPDKPFRPSFGSMYCPTPFGPFRRKIHGSIERNYPYNDPDYDHRDHDDNDRDSWSRPRSDLRDHRNKSPAPDFRNSSGSCHHCLNVCALTKQGVPSAPRSFTARGPLFQGEPPRSLTGEIRWESPTTPNGDLNEYQLQYEGNGRNMTCQIVFSGRGDHGKQSNCECNYGTHSCNIKMNINSTYTFRLRVRNSGVEEYSPEVSASVSTSSGWPFIIKEPFKSPNESVKEDYYLHLSYPIMLLTNRFKDENGPITDFMILLKTRYDHVPYQQYRRREDLLVKTIKNDTTTIVYHDVTVPSFFVFGNEYESECLEGREVCNKYLEADTEYFFQFVVFSNDRYTESPIYMFRTQQNIMQYVVTMIIIILLLIVILTIVGLFIYKRYFAPIIKRGVSMELPLLVPSTMDDTLSKPIPLSEIETAVERLLANGGQALHREYQELKSASPSKPAEEAKNGYNPSKNRYINILPFDETRVILNEYRGIPNSDYINASYIHGYEKAKEFIACQGPREQEKDDFWRMIWEKNVHVIVMVTKCVESRTEKCCKYWPDMSENKALSLSLSRLQVRTLMESPHQAEGYIYRKIELCKSSSLIPKRRFVKHFHYTLWPDMGCPRDPKHLIDFVTLVKKAIPDESSHTVVHCSAGVGRTGTFIALNNLMDEMKARNSVDVFQTVYKMRQNRENMVQTQDQYSFLYKCILKHYQTPRDNVEVTLPDTIPDLVTNTLNANNALTGYDPYKEDPNKNSNNSKDPGNIYPVEEECGEFPLESMSEDDVPMDCIEMRPSAGAEVMDDYMEDTKKTDQGANKQTDADNKKQETSGKEEK